MGQFWQQEYVNPVDVYIQFKAGGEDALRGKFYTYDKEAKQNVEVELGEFIIVKTAYTVIGYSDRHETGIFSNTVDYLREELDVRTYDSKLTGKKETIAHWLYADIKGDILAWGGRLYGVYYILLSDGRLAYLSLKGMAWMNLSTALKAYGYDKVKYKVSEINEEKKGWTKFLVPVFGQGADITEAEAKNALAKVALLTREDKNDTPSRDDLVEELEELAKNNEAKEVEKKEEDDMPW